MTLDSVLPKLWPTKSCLKSSLVSYILFFSIYILNTQDTVLSLRVCQTEKDQCSCSSNNNTKFNLTKAVQCLGDCSISKMKPERKPSESYKLFCEVMSQFNCDARYSVKWDCTDCLDAYTKWLLAVCADNTTWLSNCIGEKVTDSEISTVRISFCKKVLARCPYLAPENSYGDSPAFDCAQD